VEDHQKRSNLKTTSPTISTGSIQALTLQVIGTCVWAGVDNAWEQEKLEARKMLENAADSHTSGAPKKMASHHFIREKPPRLSCYQYTRNWQARKPYKAVETREVAVPRCTVVSGQIDLHTGGKC
jgi:hypothetical protein